MESVTLTIDGQQVTVEKGKTVLQASIEHGIKVPYYCYHPGLDRRLLPRLPREDREDAEAPDGVLDAGCRGHGRDDGDPRRRRGAGERVRVSPHQPSARLPRVRQ